MKKPQRAGLGTLFKKSEPHQQSEINGIRLSEVKAVTLAMLKKNPLNITFFQEESSEYFEALTKDIQERGILVPIIAKEDGTLLAGHNRLHVAEVLGFKTVPVQYVEEVLTLQQEQHFVISDNLLRRHLKPEQRIALYKKLYPNFDARITTDTRGGDRKSSVFKTQSDKNQSDKKQSGKNQTGNFQFDSQSDTTPLSAPLVAQHTGQSVETVRKDFQKYRAALAETSSASKQRTSRSRASQDVSPQKRLLDQANKHIQALHSTLQKADGKTKRAIKKELQTLLNAQ